MIQGNYIGTDATGLLDRGNHSDDGVEIQNNASGNQIGGTASGAANLIAFNQRDGVNIVSGTGNLVLGNSIFENGGLGIDLGTDGVGAGGGANNDKTAPVLNSITSSGSDFTVVATVTSGDTIEYFRVNNPAAPVVTPDGSGSGEGYLFLGSCVDGGGVCIGPHICLSGLAPGGRER